jgi:hypothetical protein
MRKRRTKIARRAAKRKPVTRAARSRKGFEKAARKRFNLSAAQARELRIRFEAKTGSASKAGLAKHPKIAKRLVSSAKRAVTKAMKKAMGSGRRGHGRGGTIEGHEIEGIDSEIFEPEGVLDIEGDEEEY